MKDANLKSLSFNCLSFKKIYFGNYFNLICDITIPKVEFNTIIEYSESSKVYSFGRYTNFFKSQKSVKKIKQILVLKIL